MLLISGNSIAAGYFATAPEKMFSALVAAALGVTPVNIAVSGDMVPDQAGPTYNNPLAAGDVGMVINGTNDNRAYGADTTKQAIFVDGLRALAVYQAANRKDARSSAVTRINGDWYDNIYTAHGLGIAATVPGSKVSFTFSGDVLYLGMIRQAGNSGSFKITEGSTDKGTYTLGGAGQTFKQAAIPVDYGPKCIRIAGFGPGSHTVVMEVLANRVYFDWYADATPYAHVLVANIPFAKLYGSGGSDASVTATNNLTAAMLAELLADGLSVHLVDINASLLPVDMDSDYHPIDTGHQKMANDFIAAYNALGFVTDTETMGSVYVHTSGSVKTVFVGPPGTGRIQLLTA